MCKTLAALFLSFFCTVISYCQTYTLNGSARQDNCNCYTLTPELLGQSGSVWNNNKIDLSRSFDFRFNVYLGCRDANGADGIAFILQTVNSSVGRSGAGLGFEGVSPSIGIELDTYRNGDYNDPDFDHISILANGNLKHGSDLAGPIEASATSNNIEDCNWHVLRIAWNATTKEITTYFDGVLRLTAKIDLLKDIFGSAESVYWGFSGSTGGLYNEQKFCTALNPDFITNSTNFGTCIGSSLSLKDRSESFAPLARYYWNFGDGRTSVEANPTHLYTAPGVYPVKYVITGADGCISDTLKKQVTIGSIPDATFAVRDTCFKKTPFITSSNTNIGVQYRWQVDGANISTNKLPSLQNLTPGLHRVTQTVTSEYGCGADVKDATLTIKNIPLLTATVSELCINQPTFFTAAQTDNETTITGWRWNFGNSETATAQSPQNVFKKEGRYTARLSATASNGCTSDTVVTPFTIIKARAFAGNDSIVLNGVPFQLKGEGNGRAQWQPFSGLNQTNIYTPTGILIADQTYVLQVTTDEGCQAVDSVKFTVFNGSAIYVPTAFTPNGNGLNDVLRPRYPGIKKLFYFTIFNRWGQTVFSTNNLNGGWDGTLKGSTLPTGTYVWMLKAEDIGGKMYHLKGQIVLIR